MSLTLIWPFIVIHGQILIILCTVSDLLVEIDHKGPNWTFLTLKMTFRVIPYLSYFRTGLVSQQRSYMMQYIWAALWNISKEFNEIHLLTVDQYHPKNLYTREKDNLSDRFWENWQKVAKQPNLTYMYFGPFEPWKFGALNVYRPLTFLPGPYPGPALAHQLMQYI